MCKIEPFNLKCEYMVNPVGIDTLVPRLGWMLQSKCQDQVQAAYRILVSGSEKSLEQCNGDTWDSGKVHSDNSANIAYAGKMLEPFKRYFWKVCVWDNNNDEGEWSDTAYWETGPVKQDDWKALWMSAPWEGENLPLPMFRINFEINSKVRYARAYVCGLGYYELYVNGMKSGSNVLDPAQTDYEKRVFYVTHDVSDNLLQGRNTAGIILSDGWYNQCKVWEGRMSYGKPRFIMQLLIAYEDGTVKYVTSNESTKVCESPVLASNLYAGEVYDARLEKAGWAEPDFDDSRWENAVQVDSPGGKLVAQMIPPIRRMKVIQPVKMVSPEKGIHVFDMGRNFAGWAKITLREREGTEVKLRFAETVHENGMLNTGSTGVYATGVEQIDTYYCKGSGKEIWEPRFTYHGFRYVEVTGLSKEPSLDDIEGIVVYTGVKQAGEFECSDHMINRIHRMALWTQISNLHSVPTDCPAREKCGWLGDAQVITEMTIYNFDMALFWEKYLWDMETSRKGGMPFDIAPGKRSGSRGIPDWSTALIQIPWYVYLYYGDKSILGSHYEGMKLVIDNFAQRSKDWILYEGRGDWCPPGSIVPSDTPIEITSTGYFYMDTVIMKKVAGILGKVEDAGKFEGWEQQIKIAFNEAFYDNDANTYGSQTADSFALFLRLVPDGKEKLVAKSLADNVMHKHKGHFSTGITGSKYLYWALSNYGHGDVARKILNNETYPSIGYLFKKGATTFWETWEEEAFSEYFKKNLPRSMNHPMHGGFTSWFYQGLAGINPDPEQPGFKGIILKPQIIDKIHYIRAEYNSAYGLISSRLEKKRGILEWEVEIPVNTTATICFPTSDPHVIWENGNKLTKVRKYTVEGEMTKAFIGSGKYLFSINK